MRRAPRMPRWAVALSAALALAGPAIHAYTVQCPGADRAYSGHAIGDTPFFIAAMDQLRSGFRSPYAVCDAPWGERDPRYFALPHHALYGLLGLAARATGTPDAAALAAANAVCAFLMMLAAWRLIAALAPRRAPAAFLLFALFGGIGGPSYLAAWALGAADAPGFEAWFHRYARYDLIEGSFLSPLLVMPRLYYTLALALAYAALARLVARRRRPDVWMCAALVVATLVNARVGLLAMLAGSIAIAAAHRRGGAAQSARSLAALSASVIPVVMLVSWLFAHNLFGEANVALLLRRSAWYGSLVAAAPIPLACLAYVLARRWRALPPLPRIAAGAACGYLAVFSLLYVAHQVYWGNLLAGGDAAAAAAISDWALAGAPLGALAAIAAPRGEAAPQARIDGVLLWCLAFLAVGISAWGGGRMLGLMPERFLALLGLPLAAAAAEALALLRMRRPRLAGAALAMTLACGAATNAVAALCFNGPFGLDGAAFDWVYPATMPREDAALLDAIGRGTVLAPATLPPLPGDLAVLRRPGTRTVLGQPTLEFAARDMAATIAAVQHFFDPAHGDPAARRAQLDAWCVDYVLCPASPPVDSRTLAQLDALPGLEAAARAGEGVLYRVRRAGAAAS